MKRPDGRELGTHVRRTAGLPCHERRVNGGLDAAQVRQVVIDKGLGIQVGERCCLGAQGDTEVPVAMTRSMGNPSARRFPRCAAS